MKHLRTNKYNNEQGYTLLITVFVLVVLSVLGLSMFLISNNSLNSSTNERVDQSLYYIAEAGLVEKYNEIEKLIKPTFDSINQIYNAKSDSAKKSYNFEEEFFKALENQFDKSTEINDFEELFSSGKPIANITVEDQQVDEKTKTYTITSIGSINNARNSKRAASRTITVSLDSYDEEKMITIPANIGIYALNDVILSNGYINGDIVLAANTCKKVNITNSGNPSINGTILIPNSCSKNNTITAEQWWKDQHKPKIENHSNSYEFPLPEFPEFPTGYPTLPNTHSSGIIKDENIIGYDNKNATLKLDSNYRFKNIVLNGNNTITLDIGDRNISIVVDNISGQGNLDVKGTGTLTIYLKDNFELRGHFNSSESKVTMFVDSSKPGQTKTIKTSDYADFVATIYAKDANLILNGSGKIYGNIISGGSYVELVGDPRGVSKGYAVYAPNAHVKLTGSGKLVGSVISNTFSVDGGATITAPTTDIVLDPIFSGGGGKSNSVKVFTNPVVTSTPTKEVPNK